MNELNTEWEIEKDIENIIDSQDENFQIKKLELVHHHFNSGEKELGMPISTSIEIVSELDLEKEETIWFKKVTHKYCGFYDVDTEEIDSFVEQIENPEYLLEQIKSVNLRSLNNNYFTESTPERNSHWEIIYNYFFKIVGTFDNEIDEYKYLCNILGFKQIIDLELDKIEYEKERINI